MALPNIIILHGALGSQAQFENLASLLSDRFRVWRMNFSGHGGRAFEGPYGMDKFADELTQFMDENSIERSAIFGYSMGGYVALHFAAKHPEKVSGIMTLGTKFNWTPESALKETAMLNIEKMKEKVPQFCEILKLRHAPLSWEEVVKNTADMMLRLGNGEAIHPSNMDIRVPVSITVGSADNMVSIEESERAAQGIASSEFFVFEGFRHPIEQIDQGVLAEKIRSVLSTPRKS